MSVLPVPDMANVRQTLRHLRGGGVMSPMIRWHTHALRLRLPDPFWRWAEAEAGRRLMPVEKFVAEWLQVWYVDRMCHHHERTPALPHGAASADDPHNEEEDRW